MNTNNLKGSIDDDFKLRWPRPQHDLSVNGGFDEISRPNLSSLTYYPNTLPPYEARSTTSSRVLSGVTKRTVKGIEDICEVIDTLRDRYSDLFNDLHSREELEGLRSYMGFSEHSSCILLVGIGAKYNQGFQHSFAPKHGFKSNHRYLYFSPSRFHFIEFTGGNHRHAATAEHWRVHDDRSVMEHLVTYAKKQQIILQGKESK